jgi:hypothetical protein
MPNTPPPVPPVPAAVRLIFETDGNQVRLISEQPVDVAIPGFDISQSSDPGYYIDTRDAGGNTLVRVAARDAFPPSVEVFPEKAGDPIQRIAPPVRKGAFSVLVPATQKTRSVSLVKLEVGTEVPRGIGEGTSGPLRATTTVKEIATFQLTSTTKQGEQP